MPQASLLSVGFSGSTCIILVLVGLTLFPCKKCLLPSLWWFIFLLFSLIFSFIVEVFNFQHAFMWCFQWLNSFHMLNFQFLLFNTCPIHNLSLSPPSLSLLQVLKNPIVAYMQCALYSFLHGPGAKAMDPTLLKNPSSICWAHDNSSRLPHALCSVEVRYRLSLDSFNSKVLKIRCSL